MKTRRSPGGPGHWWWGGLLLLAGLTAISLRASSREQTLEAIQHVENPRGSLRPGRHGELGAYQFRASTWRMHTEEPFARAVEPGLSKEVAIRHYEWLKRGLERNGLSASAYNIALAWNSGLRATVRGRATTAAHNYAERVTNLLEEKTGDEVTIVR